MKRLWRTSKKRGRLLPALAAAAALSCSGSSSPSEPGDGGATGPTVTVSNNSFAPATLEVPVNSTVTWQWNSGGIEHNVTFETAPSSGNRTSGSFPRTFQTAGTYAYVCTIHAAQGMSGVVNVTAGTGGGGGGGDGGDGGGGGYGS
jgi:plastocyanin